ncbi:MAG: Gfo/Idh/MocA family oxidoreductase [Lachnospira sp.]|nr:Gfo/Idh/MocA family oxidoreductase [Lachnospira sp.]
MENLRFALVGTGGMGRKYAMMLTDGSVKGAMLTAVVCRKEEAKQWAKNQLPADMKVYSSADELFDEPDGYDAVLIVTPHKTHPDLAVKAFSLGKHVFCDKPAGVSVGQAQRMEAAAKESGKLYAMMFHQRKYDKHIRMKEIMDSGDLGKIERVMLVNSRYYRTAHYHASGSWRSSWAGEGGGALINQGQHILDIWQWLFGLPTKIYANIPFGKYNNFQVDDEATIMMNYPDGMSAVFMLSTGEAVWEERMEIVGSRGTLLMEDNKLTLTIYGEDSRTYGKNSLDNSRNKMTFSTTTEEYSLEAEPYVEMFENFAAAVTGKESLTAPGHAGTEVLQITNGAYLSAWKGETVTLPIDADEYEKELQKQIEQENK